MAEGDDDQDEAEADKRFAYPQTNDQQPAGHEFDKRNGCSCCPKRPNGKKGVGKRKEVFARVVKRPQLKDLIHSGHEEDKTQHFAREEYRPASIRVKY